MSYRSSPAFARAPCSTPAPLEYGRCRICGCVDDYACIIGDDDDELGGRACGWADADHTLCDNPACLASARSAEAEARP